MIGKRCAHQRVQPCVCGSTQSSTISGESTIRTSRSASRISIWKTSSSAITAYAIETTTSAIPLLRDVRLLVAGQADLADGGGEGVVDLDEDAREREREVHGEGGEDDAGEQLHRPVVGAADVLPHHHVEAAPHHHQREAGVGDRAREVPEGTHGRALVGALSRRARDEVERGSRRSRAPS